MECLRGLNRLRFSLRSILAIVVIAALFFNYLLRPEAVRRQLIVDIEGLGGTVTFDDSIRLALFRSQRVAQVMIPYKRLKELGAMRLKSFPNLTDLRLKEFLFETENGQIRGPWMQLKISDELLKNLDSQLTKSETP